MERDWDKLKKWIVRRHLEGTPVTAICAQAKISRKVFYFWWNQYQAEGWNGLQEKQKGRPQGPELDDALRKKVVKLRERYDWGPNKIVGHLSHKGFNIDHNQAYQVICEAGLNHPIGEPRKTWGTKRFQREDCNSLRQADFKLCNDEQILTDQGTQVKPARGETSEFDRHCCELGIEHITASVRRPTTCGKIEAFHKAYKVESHLLKEHWSFIRYYNYIRPHEGLNYLTPAEIYLKDKECNLFLDRTNAFISLELRVHER